MPIERVYYLDRCIRALEDALHKRGLRRADRQRYARMQKEAKRQQTQAVREVWKTYRAG